MGNAGKKNAEGTGRDAFCSCSGYSARPGGRLCGQNQSAGGKLREGSGGASEAAICRIMGGLQGCGVPIVTIYKDLPVIYSNFQ